MTEITPAARSERTGSSSPVATLLAEGISRSFRGVKALTDVTISIQRGRVTGLIGANGAGKSTLVNIISGYDRPDQGAVILDGTDITAQRSFKRSRSGVARTFQHGHIFRALTVLENVEVTALASGNRGKAARALSVSILDSLDLLDWATNPATHLPHGVERRLGVARALATSPSYLLLDEPAAGLNDGEMEHFKETIRALSAERQIGVLLIDHNMPLIFGVSDHIYVLGAGKNVLDGEPPVVRSDEKLASSYLGSMAATIAGG